MDLNGWIDLNVNENNKWDGFWASGGHSHWQWRNRDIYDESFQRPSCLQSSVYLMLQDYEEAMRNDEVVRRLLL